MRRRRSNRVHEAQVGLSNGLLEQASIDRPAGVADRFGHFLLQQQREPRGRSAAPPRCRRRDTPPTTQTTSPPGTARSPARTRTHPPSPSAFAARRAPSLKIHQMTSSDSACGGAARTRARQGLQESREPARAMAPRRSRSGPHVRTAAMRPSDNNATSVTCTPRASIRQRRESARTTADDVRRRCTGRCGRHRRRVHRVAERRPRPATPLS